MTVSILSGAAKILIFSFLSERIVLLIMVKLSEYGRPTNAERRRLGEEYGNRWTIGRLWTEYKLSKPNLKGAVTDENRYKLHIKKYFSKKSPDEVTHEDIERLKRS